MRKELCKKTAIVVIPAMLSFGLSGVYGIADGYFLGNAIGDKALAAINIAYPLMALLQALGTGLGMGGAVGYGLAHSTGNEKKANMFFSVSIISQVVMCLILMPMIYFFSPQILSAFGASGEILSMGIEYMRVISFGAIFQIMSSGLLPLTRNLGSYKMASLAMVLGFCFNVVFDGLFVTVFGLGMWGGAVATLMGQAVASFTCIIAIIKKKQKVSLTFESEVLKNIIKTGISSFGLTLMPNIVLIFINKFLAVIGGDEALTSYAIISYVIWIILLLVQGVGDGSQPLFTYYYAKGEEKTALEVRNIALLYSVVLVVLFSSVIYLTRYQIPVFFGSSSDAIADIMPIFLVGLLFAPLTRVITSYFFATEKNKLSYTLVYGELVLLLIYLFVGASLFGLTGVWLSTPLSQISIALISIVLALKTKLK